MKRLVLVVAALLITLLGLGLIAGGALGIRVFGTSGSTTVALDSVSAREGSVALVADLVGAEADLPLAQSWSDIAIGARSQSTTPIFVGVAPQPEIDEYLFGLPYDVIHNTSGSWEEVPVPGVTTSVEPPQQNPIWTASDIGIAARIPVERSLDEARTMVIMNADGTPGPAVDLEVDMTSPRIFPVSVAALSLGLLLVLIGVPGVFRWGRGRRTEEEAL